MDTTIITAGRTVNEKMASYVATQVLNAIQASEKRILVLGLTFKENVPDTRNSKSGAVIRALQKEAHTVVVHDPFVDSEAVKKNGWEPGSLEEGPYDAIVLLVPHAEYLAIGVEGLLGAVKNGGLVYDLKSVLDGDAIRTVGRKYLAL
jgi:UDP-N-acetyl-D-glucosamine/UDP-N-acetyl-D-galactosamine dehydrogenase